MASALPLEKPVEQAYSRNDASWGLVLSCHAYRQHNVIATNSLYLQCVVPYVSKPFAYGKTISNARPRLVSVQVVMSKSLHALRE